MTWSLPVPARSTATVPRAHSPSQAPRRRQPRRPIRHGTPTRRSISHPSAPIHTRVSAEWAEDHGGSERIIHTWTGAAQPSVHDAPWPTAEICLPVRNWSPRAHQSRPSRGPHAPAFFNYALRPPNAIRTTAQPRWIHGSRTSTKPPPAFGESPIGLVMASIWWRKGSGRVPFICAWQGNPSPDSSARATTNRQRNACGCCANNPKCVQSVEGR
jgi:hypothetical protein